MESEREVTRESVLEIVQRMDKIEESLRELKAVLDKNNVGMNDPLVDAEGFPRHDIDVYQVRHARHKIICLQNDRKALMQEVEQGLHQLHSQTKQTSSEPVTIAAQSETSAFSQPIARVDYVHPESPASFAGLQVDDLILEFGSINFNNFKSTQDIGSVVQHSVGSSVPLVVKRGGCNKRLVLTPKEWSGRGLLGCMIVPAETVER